MVDNYAGTYDENDSVFALTAHEMAYLLALVDNEESATAKRILGIPTPENNNAFLLAGAATLLARRLAFVTEDELVVPNEAAALVAQILTNPSSWIELALMSEPETEAAYVAIGSGATVVLSPRFLGMFEVRFIRPEQSGGRGIADILLAFLESHVPAVTYARIVVGPEDDIALAVRLLQDGTLELSRDEGKDLDSGTVGTDRERIAARIADIIDEGVRGGAPVGA